MLLFLTSTALSGGGAPPQLQSTPCVYDLPSGFQEGRDVSCATLTVPERHDRPGAGRIKLHVIRLHGQGKGNQLDPVVYLHGGPGGDVEGALSRLGAQFVSAAGGRDVILFDQRGGGLSAPLVCSTSLTPEQQFTRNDLAYIRAMVADNLACRDQLLDAGVDLNAYNAAQIAGDVETLRQALGATQLNLYGNSYGTRVAQETLRRYPTSVRSVVLDGPVPAGAAPDSYGKLLTRALHAAFRWCARDTGCHRTYPEAQARFTTVLDRLDRDRRELAAAQPDVGVVSVPLSSTGVLEGLFGLLYGGRSPLTIPGWINPAYQGNDDELALLMAYQLRVDSYYGVFYPALCTDLPPRLRQTGKVAGEWPQVRRWSDRDGEVEAATCQAYGLKPDPLLRQPVHSDKPALILAGELDPITPPAYAELLASHLTNSTVVVFSQGGHGQTNNPSTTKCTFELLKAFWAQPDTKLNTHCVR